TLIIVDLEERKEIERVEVKVNFPFLIESHKKGFSGIFLDENVIYCATWDRIICLDRYTFRVLNEYTSPFFSDLHGIYKDEDTLYVTSTNLSSLLSLNLNTGVVKVVYTYTGFSIEK